jgi:hypothetical protein
LVRALGLLKNGEGEREIARRGEGETLKMDEWGSESLREAQKTKKPTVW